MSYKPIGSGWVVLAVAVAVVLGALCKVASGDVFAMPRLLWYVPVVIFDGVGIGLAGVLATRVRRYILRRREGLEK
jgi:hypothetical protein